MDEESSSVVQSEEIAVSSVEAVQSEIAGLKRQLIEQEHRLWPVVRNFLATRDEKTDGEEAKTRYQAARLALIRRLFFRPGAVGIAVGGVGLAGILVAGWTALLFQNQNQLFENQNVLFRQQNVALLEQFESESADRDSTRRVELLNIIYNCGPGEWEDQEVCRPAAHSRARKEAAEAFARIESKHERRLILFGAQLGVELHLPGEDLSGADLRRSDLSRATLSGVLLVGADLTSVKLSAANLKEANLRGATLVDGILSDADLTSVDLRGANLDRATLTGANLSFANLGRDLTGVVGLGSGVKAVLYGANLTDAYVDDAILNGADLRFANLTGADLTRAKLRGANLLEANLTGTYLGDADLTDAYLTNADFTNANLTDADLSSANLTDTNISQEQVDMATGNRETRLPPGIERPSHWLEAEERID